MPRISQLSTEQPGSTSDLVVNIGSTTRRANAGQIVGAIFTSQGQLPYAASSGNSTFLNPPSSNAILSYSSGSSAPAWIVGSSGQLFTVSSAGVTTVLAAPTSASFLFYSTANSSVGPRWLTLSTMGAVFASSNSVPIFTTVVQFDSSGILEVEDGLTAVDSGAWNAATVRIGHNMNSTAGTTIGDSNEGVLNVHGNITGNESQADYEKKGIFARVHTADNSVYTPGSSRIRDAVGIRGHGEIVTVSSGRAWGGTFVARAHGTADGLLVSLETELDSSGSDQPDVDQTDSKYGVHVVTITGDGTAGIYINRSGTAQWHKGINISTVAIDRANSSDALIRYGTDFVINSSGHLGIGKLPTVSIDTTGGINATTNISLNSSAFAGIGVGTSGQILESTGGIPTWVTPPAAAATQSFILSNDTSQAIPADSWTPLNWNVEIRDTENAHTTVSNSSRVIIPTSGTWVFGAQVNLVTSGADRLIQIAEGTTTASTRITEVSFSGANANTRVNISGMQYFASSGSTIGVQVYSAGSSNEINTGTIGARFWGHRLS